MLARINTADDLVEVYEGRDRWWRPATFEETEALVIALSDQLDGRVGLAPTNGVVPAAAHAGVTDHA